MDIFGEPTICHITDEIYGLIFNLVFLTEKLEEWRGEKQPIAEEGTRHLPENVAEMVRINWVVSRFPQSGQQADAERQGPEEGSWRTY